MLLDDFLPVYQFAAIHTIAIDAPASRVRGAIKEVTLAELPLFRVLLGLRRLRWTGLRGPQTLFHWAQQSGFVWLGETDQELLVGIVGQPWQLRGSRSPRIITAQDFRMFAHPGYVKVATNFSLQHGLGERGVTLSTETRIHALDATTRRKFALYWRLIRLGSGLIRKEWLTAIRRRAEGQ